MVQGNLERVEDITLGIKKILSENIKKNREMKKDTTNNNPFDKVTISRENEWAVGAMWIEIPYHKYNRLSRS